MTENTHPHIPASTYRLQFHGGFTFRDAKAILGYLDKLGISDVYASPYFQASPDSTHGYDVADHNRLSPAIGDASDFRAFSSEIRERGMGHVLDFVPNHMGIGESLNKWWMEVLEDGLSSPFAHYFDIDWNPVKAALSQRVMLPILGERYGKVLELGELKLQLEKGAFSLKYFDTKLPLSPATYPEILRPALTYLDSAQIEQLREVLSSFSSLAHHPSPEAKAAAKKQLHELVSKEPGIAQAIDHAMRALEGEVGKPESFDPLHELLEAQAYRLGYWRTAAEEINYRRFFDINTLAAIRVEIPEVFEAAHQLVFELLSRGDVTGLRIDHVDGLWNPKEYLERVQQRYSELCGITGNPAPLYLLVEKIVDLTRERMPGEWLTHGTTGYEFANQVVQVFTEKASEKRLTRIYQRFTGVMDTFSDLVYEKKILTMLNALSSEVTVLGKMLDEISELHRNYRDFSRNTLTAAVREVMACFPVYRTYVTEDGTVSAEDEKIILRAISSARRRNPTVEKAVFDFLRSVLLLRLPENLTEEHRAAHVRFVMKFQQCSSPVMAKSVEDTAFYIYNRLVALNEVGGNPDSFGIEASEFHRLNIERLERFPHNLLGTTTHDTKRHEDTRMRIVALSEVPDAWQSSLQRWSRLNRRQRTKIGDETAPSPNEEYLLYQILLGTWPLEAMDDEGRQNYIERIQQYMGKAMKEAKINSSWTEPNEEWEKAVTDFVANILTEKTGQAFLADFQTFADQVAQWGAMNSLSEVVLKCTSPGVPDFYQGTEIWNFSLVDPDNRRPVDYTERQQLLDSLAGASTAELMQDWKSGRIKLALIHRLMTYRRENAEFFRQAGYQPLEVTGRFAKNILAYVRESQGRSIVVIVPRLTAKMGFAPTGDAWGDTTVLWEGGQGKTLRNLLSADEPLTGTDSLPLATLLATVPFAVLETV